MKASLLPRVFGDGWRVRVPDARWARARAIATVNMPRFGIDRWTVLFAALYLCGTPSGAGAQPDGYSIQFGTGRSFWSGPYTRGGQGLSLFAAALEWRVARAVTARAELGGALHEADMGNTGFLQSPTTLSVQRIRAAALGRLNAPKRAGEPRFFLELGAAVWFWTRCDVDTAHGLGFFGGETVGCGAWESGVSSDPRPLHPNASGIAMLSGIGANIGRVGLTLRYESRGRAVIETADGPMNVQALVLAGDWVFKGRR